MSFLVGGLFGLWWLLNTPSAPWWSFFIPGLFALLGGGLMAWLLRKHWHTWRLGPATLEVVPRSTLPGETVVLNLTLERRDLGNREVTFSVAHQQPDDESGWTTLQSSNQTSALASGLCTVSAAMRIPPTAQPSGPSPFGASKRRWLATARVAGLHLADIDCAFEVLPLPDRGEPSGQAIVLNARPSTTTSASAKAPLGARQIGLGAWAWDARSQLLVNVGRALMIAALVWLFITARSQMTALGAMPTGASLALMGSALFRLPFWVSGFALALIALGLMTLRQHVVVRSGSIAVSLHSLGKVWITERVSMDKILFLRATESIRHGDAVLRYGLLAKMKGGSVSIPIQAPTVAELELHARWLAQMLGTPSLSFDPEVDVQGRTVSNAQADPRLLEQIAQLTQKVRWFKWALAAASILGMLGFVLVLVATLAMR